MLHRTSVRSTHLHRVLVVWLRNQRDGPMSGDIELLQLLTFNVDCWTEEPSGRYNRCSQGCASATAHRHESNTNSFWQPRRFNVVQGQCLHYVPLQCYKHASLSRQRVALHGNTLRCCSQCIVYKRVSLIDRHIAAVDGQCAAISRGSGGPSERGVWAADHCCSMRGGGERNRVEFYCSFAFFVLLGRQYCQYSVLCWILKERLCCSFAVSGKVSCS